MNSVDIAVGVVLLISAVISLVRGFVHELLSHTGWVASGLAAYWGVLRVPEVRAFAGQYIHNELLRDIAAGVVIFLVVLVLTSIVTHAVARRVQQSALGGTDRALGFVFGLVRGLLLCSLAYMVVIWLMPQPPDWFKTAKSMQVVVPGAHFIQSLLPEQIAVLEQSTKDAADSAQQLKATTDELNKDSDLLNKLQAPQPATPNNQAGNKKQPPPDQKGMDRLIENSTGK